MFTILDDECKLNVIENPRSDITSNKNIPDELNLSCQDLVNPEKISTLYTHYY